MILDVDTTSSVPIYAQIVSQVKNAIGSGVVRPGEFLPSLRDCAKSLRINPLTVAKAYRELEVIGLVCTDHGRGTYVSHEASVVTAEHRQEELRRLADRLALEGYHLSASPEEIAEAVRMSVEAMRPEFEARDAKKGMSNG